MSEKIPERASRSMLEVPIGAKRNQLDIEKDTWWAVAELAKGKTYREIAKELSEKNGYSISYVQIWHDINDALIEWKRGELGEHRCVHSEGFGAIGADRGYCIAELREEQVTATIGVCCAYEARAYYG